MSQALTVLNNQTDLAMGGIGLDSELFKLRPSTFELVQNTSQQKEAVPGKFRNTSTNEHFDEIRAVILINPQRQRAFYEGEKMSRDNKKCFSLDNVKPHPKAKEPQAMTCAVCPKGDKNWDTWRKTKSAKDLPPCKMYWHVVFAERNTQMIHYINAKGKSVTPFEQAMQNLARTLAGMTANTRAKNKQIEAANAARLAEMESKLTPAAQKEELEKNPLISLEPMPNVFDVSFTLYPIKDGTSWVIGFKDFKALTPDSRKEFGNVYVEYFNSRQSGNVAEQIDTEEREAEAAVSEAPAVQEVASVINQAQGVIVGKDEPITI